ncbi:MAG: S8 family serine peptidase [Candidatus Abawacabacteria bacterium]|nr:S8 family serine peptidase [Candidatus Abawacabacteria bacterium]
MLSKRLFVSLALALLMGGLIVQPGSELFQARLQDAYAALQGATSDTFLLTARNGDTAALEASLARIRKNYAVTSVERLSKDSNTVIVTFEPDEDIVMAMASGDDNVKIEPDYILKAVGIPSDAQYAEQWYLRNTAQTYHTSASATTKGIAGNDVNWQPMYENSGYRGAPITVAVIDSGVTATHPDLSDRLWVNSKESNDSIDNDQNGLLNDINGWNFVDDNNNLTDKFGHGTQVAGIIAARNDSVGLVGIAPASKIMPLRVLGDNGYGSTSDVIQAINYAIEKKAHVINMSLGAAYADSAALINACNNAVANGIVVVAAAGNSNQDITTYHFAPANISSVIAVGSITSSGTKASFSNTGNALSLVTPGLSIVSTRAGSTGSSNQVLPDGSKSYIIASGTSFSSPMVAAAAALVLEKNPGFSVSQVRNQLQNTATDLGSAGKDTQFGYGLLNVTSALSVSPVTKQVANRAPKIANASWSPSNFNNEKTDSVTLTVKASDPNNDTLTVTADLSVLGLSLQTLTASGNNQYRSAAVTPTVATGTYTIPVEVSDGNTTVSKSAKLKVTQVAPSISITKPTSRATYTTTKSSIVLSGVARGPINQIKINGAVLSSFVPRQTRWSQTISLPQGTTTYTVVGYNANNEIVDTKSIAITRN